MDNISYTIIDTASRSCTNNNNNNNNSNIRHFDINLYNLDEEIDTFRYNELYTLYVNYSVKSYLSFKNYIYHSSYFPTMYNFGPLIYNNGQNVICKNAYSSDRDDDYYYIHVTDYLRDNVK